MWSAVRASVSPTQPTAGPAGHERLLVDVAGDLAHVCDRTDRRDHGQGAAKSSSRSRPALRVAAVRIGADRHGLGFERAKIAALAAAHVLVECGLALALVR